MKIKFECEIFIIRILECHILEMRNQILEDSFFEFVTHSSLRIIRIKWFTIRLFLKVIINIISRIFLKVYINFTFYFTYLVKIVNGMGISINGITDEMNILLLSKITGICQFAIGDFWIQGFVRTVMIDLKILIEPGISCVLC